MATFKDFPIRYADLSSWQDDPTTTYKPTLEKVAAAGFRGVGIRCSLGVVTDRAFATFWQSAKVNHLDRMPYHLLDYYSHTRLNMGISDENWGRQQARHTWEILKPNPGELPLYLDIENSGGVSINWLNASMVGRVKFGFLDEYDKISGGRTGIYTNQGYMFLFGAADKTRDIWLSWYSRTVTLDQIRAALAKYGWTGKLRFFQYASDGDIDNNGAPEGKKLGMESTALDLDVFIGDETEYSAYSGTTPPFTQPVEKEDPPVTVTTEKMGAVIRSVNVRNSVGTGSPQLYVNGRPWVLLKDETFPVYETAYDSAGNPWLRIGYREWICSEYNGTKLLTVG